MEVRRCTRCMHKLSPAETVCPECGRVYGSGSTESFALKPGAILDGKYLVGEMLGQGGFGITYIGFDLLLEQKVAIKEYFPMRTGMVSRENASTVVWSAAMAQKTGIEKGFDSFLKEARKMAKLRNIPGVVGVNSVFIQNETAYIVMDFVEGETLLNKLQREGPMDFETCVSLLTPIVQALSQVHKHGIIHRDISPDNLMVQKDGQLILLDLGAAKDLDIQDANGAVQSSQMVAKQGFSPMEQYTKNGLIGPWTDVYAMAATIYYCCTGALPPAAIDRLDEDTLTCKPRLNQKQFEALAKCMSIRPKERPQDMESMMALLRPAAQTAPRKAARKPERSRTEKPPKKTVEKPEKQKSEERTPPKKPPKKHRPLKALIAIAVAVVCCAGALLFWKPWLKLAYDKADTLAKDGEIAMAAIAFGKLDDYNDARERSFELWDRIAVLEPLSADRSHTVGLKADGSVVATGFNESGQCDVSNWTGIISVSAGAEHTVGLKNNGTVIAVGSNEDGQRNVSGWSDIVSVSAGSYHTVGLKPDGTAVAVGWNDDIQCSVSEWSDLTAVSAGWDHTVGLKSSGTLVSVGVNGGQRNVSGWSDIRVPG